LKKEVIVVGLPRVEPGTSVSGENDVNSKSLGWISSSSIIEVRGLYTVTQTMIDCPLLSYA